MKKILTTFVSLLLIAVATIGSAKAQDPQTTYTIKFASGMDDTASWSFDPAAAHTTGVAAGTQVTFSYTGSLRVKSITVSTVNPVETPLTFVAKEANAKVAVAAFNDFGSAPTVSLEYSTDGGSNWITYEVGTTGDITLANVGDAVQFRAKSDATHTALGNASNFAYNYFTLTGDCYAYGNVMSLLYNDFDEETTFPEGSNSNFFYLFSNCSTLYNHPSVELVLPATTLTENCYGSMFYGCTALTEAPELPAKTLANYCYSNMFQNCTSLTAAPALPATQLDTNCYQSMFSGCTALTEAPELSATQLAIYCYGSMFQNCTSLTSAPALPATTLADYCYSYMFQNCTTLTAAPALSATTLANYCYNSMFSGCSALTEAPVLPATSLAPNCYSSMFGNCTNLTRAPELPATTLASSCYGGMFNGCTNLNYIKCLATTNIEMGNLMNWVYNVASSGTFVRDGNTTWDEATSSNIYAGYPSGWTVLDLAYATPLTFVAMEANASVQIDFGGLQYSTDGSTWTDYTANTTISMSAAGDKVQFRAQSGGNTEINTTFTLSGNCYVYGNVMSLLSQDFENATSLGSDAFNGLFNGCATLYNHPSIDIVLPATTLDNNCYTSMFEGCSNLTAAPELPATTLASSCYQNMFSGCTSLTAAPELPATTLAEGCYYGMFFECTGLTAAPALPVTTLAEGCYAHMFEGCTSLTTAPELPATTLTPYCYQYMFSGCNALTTAPALPATTLAEDCYNYMFFYCTSLTTGPTIAATTFSEDGGECANMFNGCTSLNSITWTGDFSGSVVEGAEATFAQTHLPNMLPSESTGTIYCPSSMTATWNALKDYINGSSWTVGDPYSATTTPLTFEAMTAGATVTLKKRDSDAPNVFFEYSTNGGSTWITPCTTSTTGTSITLTNVGDKVQFRATSTNDQMANDDSYNQFTLSGDCYVYGNVMSLLYTESDFPTATSFPSGSDYNFKSLFSFCSNHLYSHPTKELVLPATELTDYCYSYMFHNCSNLTTAPELPATTLAASCYKSMFQGCNSLNYIKCLATTGFSTINCLANWVDGAGSSATGTKNFYYKSGVTWPTGTSGIPSGWTPIAVDN